ncbi:MAG: hypothetical protein U5J64_08415 [Halobacteriales archaeon]|nr:hypothetical protein [Halobacteriales archaeon]
MPGLFGPMMKEEWRLHSRLFGGWSFGAFPLVVFVIAVAAYVGVLASGFSYTELERGVQYVRLSGAERRKRRIRFA